jgi:DNA replicative helicase MCM subunit Mcm2 (Cdc46/Mcm family)
MQKITFTCDNCETKGTIRLSDDFDDVEVQFCPACGDPLPTDGDDHMDED